MDAATDERGTTDFDYGLLGQLLSRTEPDQTEISYTYGDAGRVETVTTPAGTLSYRYDDLNRPRQVVGFDPLEVRIYGSSEFRVTEKLTLRDFKGFGSRVLNFLYRFIHL
uniref:hypothetical protein n=1 Tax=Baaleninema simplex TaxID=2862350 RepID=UPI0035C92EEB